VAGAGHFSCNQEQVTAALSKAWQLSDVQLELRELTALKVVELRSSRVFLESPVISAALQAGPKLLAF